MDDDRDDDDDDEDDKNGRDNKDDDKDDDKDDARSDPSWIEVFGGLRWFREVSRRVVLSPAAAPRRETLCRDARIVPPT